MLKMCYDKRVLGGLAVVGLGVLAVAPDLFVRALPLLLVLACPLSMLFMGRAMMGGGQRALQGEEAARLGMAASYTCPMHPNVVSASAGRCPECGMNLVPTAPSKVVEVPYRTGPALGQAEQVALLRVQLQRVGEQQVALAQQLEQLQAAETTTAPSEVVQTADQDARAAVRP